MVNAAIELMGFVCLTVFAWFVWPPLVLLVAGLLLILWANVRGARVRKPEKTEKRSDLRRAA